MRNKIVGGVTVVMSIICLYYLSFTWLDYEVQRKATIQATSKDGVIDINKKNEYLNSVWNKEAYKVLGKSFSYEQIKSKALNFGLDIQGGMGVILEMDIKDFISQLAIPKNRAFVRDVLKNIGNDHVVDELIQYFDINKTDVALNECFMSNMTQGIIDENSKREDVKKYLNESINKAINRAYEVIVSRIDKYGTSQANIQRLGNSGRMQLEVPGVNNTERFKKLLQGVAQLQFWLVYDESDLKKVVEMVNSVIKKDNILGKDGHEFRVTTDMLYKVEEASIVERIFGREDIKELLPDDFMLFREFDNKKDKEYVRFYPVKADNEDALLTGDVIVDAQQSFDDRGRVAVTVYMNSYGTKVWRDITKKNIGRCIAITLDNMVYTAPVVNTEIPNGVSVISGNYSVEEAKDLVTVLKTGSLPAKMNIVEESMIMPTLSMLAKKQGILSLLIGTLLVFVFMIVFYNKSGLIANMALLFNILFIFGTLAQLNTALSLSGIAGIVLTIGMAIDANILIFERIKEELRKGLSVRNALNIGYSKATSSIIDSNITTILTGIVLYIYGVGPIKGFATILIVGILSSFFTAVYITRLVYGLKENNRTLKDQKFSCGITKNILVNTKFDFLHLRFILYFISIMFIVVGLFGLYRCNGLQMGIDFTGGREIVFKTSERIDMDVFKKNISANIGDEVDVKNYGLDNVYKITTNYMMNSDSDEKGIISGITKNIASASGLSYVEKLTNGTKNFTIVSSNKVESSMAESIKKNAKKVVFFVLLMIFVYVILRFKKWQYGIASILTLSHDVVCIFAFYGLCALCGYKINVDQIFIAAVLTVIGYSINSTVIIFDRVREFSKIGGDDATTRINGAINSTLGRTIMTSVTTWTVVVVLFLFGGESLNSFSTVLMFGILLGMYSSIFIAAPMLKDLRLKC